MPCTEAQPPEEERHRQAAHSSPRAGIRSQGRAVESSACTCCLCHLPAPAADEPMPLTLAPEPQCRVLQGSLGVRVATVQPLTVKH